MSNSVLTSVFKTAGTPAKQDRAVTLNGLTPIMFDPYAGDNNTKLEPHEMFYFGEDRKTLCLPSANISSFLSAQNTMSAPRRLLGKKYKQVAQACLSFVSINPMEIPFLRDDKPIQFGKFENGRDALSGATIHRAVARLKDGIPNPKVRPVLHLPWQLKFTVSIFPNNEIKEETIQKLFRDGGLAIGLGTWRGVFGKFEVTSWG